MRSLRRPRESFDVLPDKKDGRATMPLRPQPSRLSSDAPEVVPGQFPDIDRSSPIPSVFSPTKPSLSPSASQLSFSKGRRSPTQSWLSLGLGSFSDRGSGKGRAELVRTPQIIYEDAEPYQPKVHTRRVFGLVTTIILVLIAFCFGGGIGGGVATAVLKMSNHKSTSTDSPVIVVDFAGCPLIANSTYVSQSGASFLVICAASILPQTGQFIDLSHSLKPTFDSCLDACGAADGCVGATWYIFDSTTPNRNSGCYLKNGTGQEVVASASLSVVSGYRTTVLPS